MCVCIVRAKEKANIHKDTHAHTYTHSPTHTPTHTHSLSVPFRPALGDVVRLADGTATSDDGSLSNMECGWVSVDEQDHQPFHVHNVNKKSYWYREREVRCCTD